MAYVLSWKVQQGLEGHPVHRGGTARLRQSGTIKWRPTTPGKGFNISSLGPRNISTERLFEGYPRVYSERRCSPTQHSALLVLYMMCTRCQTIRSRRKMVHREPRFSSLLCTRHTTCRQHIFVHWCIDLLGDKVKTKTQPKTESPLGHKVATSSPAGVICKKLRQGENSSGVSTNAGGNHESTGSACAVR